MFGTKEREAAQETRTVVKDALKVEFVYTDDSEVDYTIMKREHLTLDYVQNWAHVMLPDGSEEHVNLDNVYKWSIENATIEVEEPVSATERAG